MKNKAVSLMLAIVLLLTLTSPSAYATSSTGTSMPLSEQIRKEKIDALMDERVYFQIEHPDDVVGLSEIDDQLMALGVDFLNEYEVQQLMQDEISGQAAPYALVPDTSPNNTWMTYTTSNCLYNGKKYNIQTVVVNPKNNKSKLANEGNATLEYSDNVQFNLSAGAVSLIKQFAAYIGGEVSSRFTVIVSLIDALKASISDLQTVSIVKCPMISYTYDIKLSATFEFCRLENEPDSRQILTHISTKAIGGITAVMNGGNYRRQGSLGAWENYGQITYSGRVYAYPGYDYSGFPEVSPAIYGHVNGKIVKSCVSSMDIYGPNDKTDKDLSITFTVPNNMLDCE